MNLGNLIGFLGFCLLHGLCAYVYLVLSKSHTSASFRPLLLLGLLSQTVILLVPISGLSESLNRFTGDLLFGDLVKSVISFSVIGLTAFIAGLLSVRSEGNLHTVGIVIFVLLLLEISFMIYIITVIVDLSRW